jgi:hypothetical protein
MEDCFMFHLCAFTSGNLAQAADFDIPALTDDVLFITNNSHFQLNSDMWLIAAAAMSANLNRAKFITPSLRVIAPPYIQPPERSLLPSDLPNVMYLTDNPFRLKAAEELQILATSDLGAGSERFTGLLWLADEITPVGPGDIYWIRATSTTAAVANAWTSVVYALEQNLPAGQYELCGSEVQSTTGFAHRWIIPNQILRPGCISKTALGSASPWQQYARRLGSMGTFYPNILPVLQVLCNAADAAHAIVMAIRRVS